MIHPRPQLTEVPSPSLPQTLQELVAYLAPRAQTALEAHTLAGLNRRLRDSPRCSLEGMRARLDALGLCRHPLARSQFFLGRDDVLANFIADEIAQITQVAAGLDADRSASFLADLAAWQ